MTFHGVTLLEELDYVSFTSVSVPVGFFITGKRVFLTCICSSNKSSIYYVCL
jgi:hypothetical protein